MKKDEKLNGIIGFIFFVLGFIAKGFYREFIISNEIDDFGVAGFLPSYLYVVAFALLMQMSPFRYPILIIIVITLASILFEIKQYFGSGILDYADIIASIAGGLSAFIIVKMINKKRPLEKQAI